MAGIYLHIPFCTRKCAYCDFYSVANTKLSKDFVDAICKEIELQKNYLDKEKVQTIYFGGGTPSILTVNQIEKIITNIYKYFDVDSDCEITLEANPDNLNVEYLKALKILGVNRLSVGIQSFDDADLQLMKRRHTVNQAIESVKEAQKQGFNNISIDLIYGLPNLTISNWEKNINEALKLKIQHISAYHLTIEPNTTFHKLYNKQKLNLPTEDESIDQFKLLIDKTAQNGFLHYEISNFALDGSISLHNTNYWMGVKYLGLGPSAHSYNLTSRQWNISNLREYMDAILKGKAPSEYENLSKSEKYNDFVITSLRTMWGLNTEKLKIEFEEKYEKHFLLKTKKLLTEKLLTKSGNNFILTEKGMFISDNIIQEFLYD
ncbi:MAG: radical SAM family heme chaperone HemW [Bacteroidales bacterium]|nr:radical SAM family heme chaperone HemW [Bacteroidales bacterium]